MKLEPPNNSKPVCALVASDRVLDRNPDQVVHLMLRMSGAGQISAHGPLPKRCSCASVWCSASDGVKL